MKHNVAPDEMIELAASYSLGALSQQEARTFEDHLGEGCEACRAELVSFETTLTTMAIADEAQAPPVNVRDELLARVRAEAPAKAVSSEEPVSNAPDFISIHASEGKWWRVQKGIYVKQLSVDEKSGLVTSLVKMRPGTSLPVHRHDGVEQFYIIEGDCVVRGEVLGPGDYHRAAAGSIHESTYTVNGTMFLLVAPEHLHVLDTQ
jgi:anti-sigma factor ChrR (cupin superfamily)